MIDEGMKNVAAGAEENPGAGKFLTYGISNLPALFVGGGLLAINTLFVDFIKSHFALPEFRVAGVTLSPVLYIPELVVMVFILGYLTQCVRELAKGDYRMPSLRKSSPSMIKDGIIGEAILVEYYLIAGMAVTPAIPLLGMLKGPLCIFIVPIVILAFAILFLLVVVAFASWVIYARTGDIFRAMNIFNGIGLARSKLSYIPRIIGLMLVATIPLFIVSLLPAHMPYLSIVKSWPTFYQMASYTFIFNNFYETAIEGRMAKDTSPPASGV